MGPRSKSAIVAALGALIDAVRSLEVQRVSEERQRRELSQALGECTDAVRELSRIIGETVASHSKANTAIVELRRDHSMLDMRVESLEGRQRGAE